MHWELLGNIGNYWEISGIIGKYWESGFCKCCTFAPDFEIQVIYALMQTVFPYPS